MNYPKKVSKHITNWIENYINKSGAKGIVVGVSGGVDSALTSTLCAETGHNIWKCQFIKIKIKFQGLKSILIG